MSPTSRDVIKTSKYFQQYIAGYTVANFKRYPIRRRVTKSSALECLLAADDSHEILNLIGKDISQYCLLQF